MTPWSIILLEKLIVPQPFKNYSASFADSFMK
jgi:hypothetical protein